MNLLEFNYWSSRIWDDSIQVAETQIPVNKIEVGGFSY